MKEDIFISASSKVVIIGGGPGGYVSAIRAAQLGLCPILIEENALGGVCLNWGCIPMKSLLKSAEIFRFAHEMKTYGVSVKDISFNVEQMVSRSKKIAANLEKGVQGLIKKNNINFYRGRGKIFSKTEEGFCIEITTIEGEKVYVQGENVVLATGARHQSLPGIIPDGKTIWTYKDALFSTSIPKKLLIIGAGVIGLEFGSFYQALGTEVTLVERQGEILQSQDHEIMQYALKEYKNLGMKFLLNHQFKTLKSKDPLEVALISSEGKESIWRGDKLFLATGITGNHENLGLEMTQAKIDRTHVCVNSVSKTDEKGLYAIGDLANPPWLAHKASHEGIMCIEHIAGRSVSPLDPLKVPVCIYSFPQIASIGLSEREAENQGYKVKVGRFPFLANGLAHVQGEEKGMTKVIFDKVTGELLGAHIIGNHVSELIQGFSIAKTLEATEEDLKHVIFPHPTLSEVMQEAVLDADGGCLHF